MTDQWPTAFIVGVNKAGTTALFNALARHPDVAVSDTKETHFFDPLRYGEELPPLTAYARHFAHAAGQRVVMEATPGYFYGGRRVADALLQVAPHARAILVLRDPVTRAHSWWRFARTRLMLPADQTFAEYLDACAALDVLPEDHRDLVGLRGVSGGEYARWLPDWQRAFGDRLLVLYYEDVVTDLASTLARIGRHLGIDPAGLATERDNVSTDVESRAAQRVALRLNRVGERLWRRLPGLKRTLRRGYYRLNASRRQQTLDSAERDRLAVHYASWNARLRDLLPDVPDTWTAPEAAA